MLTEEAGLNMGPITGCRQLQGFGAAKMDQTRPRITVGCGHTTFCSPAGCSLFLCVSFKCGLTRAWSLKEGLIVGHVEMRAGV